MIEWLSNEVEAAWDSYPFLDGIVCEIHDEELKGHIVIQLELMDDFTYQLDLGDCTGLSNPEINERFCRKFGEFVKAYEDSDEYFGPALEDIEELRDKFLKSIESK